MTQNLASHIFRWNESQLLLDHLIPERKRINNIYLIMSQIDILIIDRYSSLRKVHFIEVRRHDKYDHYVKTIIIISW